MSKEHIISLLCWWVFAQSTKEKESLIVNWFVEIGLRTLTRKEACVNWGDNRAKGATSFVDFRKTIKNTDSRSTRKGFSKCSFINYTISLEVTKIGNKTVLPRLGWVVRQQLKFRSIGNQLLHFVEVIMSAYNHNTISFVSLVIIIEVSFRKSLRAIHSSLV